MISSNVDGRHARGIIARNYEECDRLEATTETAPVGVSPPNEGLTEPEWGSAMSNASKRDRADTAGKFLDMARESFEKAARVRLYYILLARKHGVTNARIGAHLGVSESAVRATVKRYADVDPGSVLLGDA